MRASPWRTHHRRVSLSFQTFQFVVTWPTSAVTPNEPPTCRTAEFQSLSNLFQLISTQQDFVPRKRRNLVPTGRLSCQTSLGLFNWCATSSASCPYLDNDRKFLAMADPHIEDRDTSWVRTAKDLFAGAAGGIAQL